MAMAIRTTETDELERLWAAPTTSEPPPRQPAPPRPDVTPLGKHAAATLTLWVVTLAVFSELRPPAAEPAIVDPFWVVALSFGFAALFIATVLGLAAGARWGYGASLAATGILAVDLVVCPLTGHHSFGAWWLAQAASVGALAAVSRAGYRQIG
jgi:hypothetical protein